MSWRISNFEEIASEALNASSSPLGIEDHSYETEYRILKDWFEKQEGVWTADTVRLGGLAIYGWMPTILRAEGRGAVHRMVDFKRVAQELNEGRVNPDQENFLNGSYVGTSKFLHFWRPAHYAIWDSRIHRALRMSGLVNSKKNFDSFQIDIRGFCETRELDLRDVELALFRAGKSEQR